MKAAPQRLEPERFPTLLPLNEGIARVAIRQSGVFSRAQALEIGFSRTQIDHRLKTGQWERILPAVFKSASDPLVWEAEVQAALLWAGPSSIASHGTAARIWELPGFAEAGVEITVSGTAKANDSIAVHRNAMSKAEVVTRGALRLTSIARTLLDVASQSSPGQLEAAVDHALLRRLVTLARLRSELDRRAEKGRDGCALLRQIVDERDPMFRPKMSELERIFFRLLLSSKLPVPTAQYPVALLDGSDVFIDFAYPELMLAIETDGYVWHGGKTQWQRDAIRSNKLVQMGWRVVRITWDDVTKHPESTLRLIARLIEPPSASVRV